MATLNVDVPRFYCLLRKEFLYDGTAHHGEFVKVCVFGAASIYGRALGFHVLTENGAVIWRLPIHSLCHKEDAPVQPLDWLQFWDCFSYDISCTAFDRLANCRVRVRLRDGSSEGGQYMFTLDWYGGEDAEEAGDGGHKCAHVIALDNGNFAAQPNNRVQWFCPAFVTPWTEKPDYLTNTSVWKVERETETTDGFFYDDVVRASQPSQVGLYAKGLRVGGNATGAPESNGQPRPVMNPDTDH
ncbi:MAG: hypothetical protein R3C18_16605 [Planctomycetaceae bacterium]